MDGKSFATNRMGWRPQDDTLTPVETDLAVAPDTLLNMVCYRCKEGGCGSMSYGYNQLGMFCTSMCTECNGETCRNTIPVSLDDDEDEDTAPTLLNIDVNDEDENESQP